MNKHDNITASLVWQPIYNWSDKLVKIECLSRFFHNGHVVNTGDVLMNMVDFGLSHKLDELVIKNGLQKVCECMHENECVKRVFTEDGIQVVFNVHPTTLIHWATDGYKSKVDHKSDQLPVFLLKQWKDGYCPDLKMNQLGIELLEDGNINTILQSLGYEATPKNERKVSNLLFRILQNLKDAGIKVMIDDFGSHYSNAFRLGLPSSGIKVDGLAVQIATDMSQGKCHEWGVRIIAAAIAQVMMDFPHTPEEVVLEHVSDKQVYDIIRRVVLEDCHGKLLDDLNRVQFQGYYFKPPQKTIEEALDCE